MGQGQKSVDSLATLRKQWDIIFINLLILKCLWQEALLFLEREFLVGGSHGKKIELDETQLTNETTQDYEMKIERPFFDISKLTQRL